MQDVRQSLRVQLEQGAAEGLPVEGLGKQRAKAGGSLCKPQPMATVRIRVRVFRLRRKKAQVLL